MSDIVAVTLGAIATQRSCCPNPINHNIGSAVQVVLVRRRLSVFFLQLYWVLHLESQVDSM